jgi:hypothetical protein
MRKGITIIEVIIVLGVLVMLLSMLTRPTRVLVNDISSIHRDIQVGENVWAMLRQLKKDVEASQGLSCDRTDTDSLLIDTDGGEISYRLAEDEVIKSNTADNEQQQTKRIWDTNNANIKWKVWTRDNKGYAVEVTTVIKRMVLGNWQEKLKNSHVYFVGATDKGVDGI